MIDLVLDEEVLDIVEYLGAANNSGYYYLKKGWRGFKYSSMFHRVLCEYFHGPSPGDNYSVDHINANILDNRKANLRWLTKFENNSRAKKDNFRGKIHKEDSKNKCAESVAKAFKNKSFVNHGLFYYESKDELLILTPYEFSKLTGVRPCYTFQSMWSGTTRHGYKVKNKCSLSKPYLSTQNQAGQDLRL